MNFTRLLPALVTVLLMACGTGAPPTSEAEGNTAEQTKEKDEAIKVKGERGRRSYTAEELNEPYSRVSPWRYIVTSPETEYFERMVGSSTLARTVHGSGHAVLVPEDLTFKTTGDWKGILDPGQEKALDRLVGAHIIKGIKGPKLLEGTYENLNGDQVSIEKNAQGQLVCGGAKLLGRELETDQGLVIPVLGLAEPLAWD